MRWPVFINEERAAKSGRRSLSADLALRGVGASHVFRIRA